MDSEFQSILGAAATEAQSHLGESFVAPDGKTYIGTFRAIDAFQAEQAGLQMQEAGFRGTTFLILTATKSQFTQPPWSWRRNQSRIIRSSASPVQRCTIKSMTADSPLFYSFVLQAHQPEAG